MCAILSIDEELASNVVRQFVSLYDETDLVFSFHLWIHLTDDLEVFGPLDHFSSLTFE